MTVVGFLQSKWEIATLKVVLCLYIALARTHRVRVWGVPMGKASRDKGKRGEREAAALLREYGFEARRGCQYQGGPDSPDVVADGLPLHFEIKRTERLSLYPAIEQATQDAGAEKIPIVLHRQSRKPWLAIIPAEELLSLLRQVYPNN
ncbi:conserved protein of unknown function [Pseudodesulfovibrio profundus]|uniref:Holliday junction resolvase n=2 Tax=Pseudodesulfovibrio profundus TaxID=57320 RepID=A0A2C8FB32_9BACT|nr:conserved protein of unknown function [Pseudodesulfovibrio profundus]